MVRFFPLTRYPILLFFILVDSGMAFAQPEELIGVRISKSGTVHLAEIGTYRDTRRTTYLPAGKRLLVYRRIYPHNGRDWFLALTEHGVYVYVLGDGTHYYNPEERSEMQSGSFAIIEVPHTARLEGLDANFPFGPSEVYKVHGRENFRVYRSHIIFKFKKVM